MTYTVLFSMEKLHALNAQLAAPVVQVTSNIQLNIPIRGTFTEFVLQRAQQFGDRIALVSVFYNIYFIIMSIVCLHVSKWLFIEARETPFTLAYNNLLVVGVGFIYIYICVCVYMCVGVNSGWDEGDYRTGSLSSVDK